MRIFSRFILLSLFSVLVAGCVRVGERMQEVPGEETALGAEKFEAWQLRDETTGKASQELLKQADELIASNQLEQASDKLDRLLRLEPKVAQAWSRLAWIALEKNAPGRTRQMAMRSNTYVRDDKQLKILNWSFIRKAAVMLDDETAIEKAEAVIKKLSGFK